MKFEFSAIVVVYWIALVTSPLLGYTKYGNRRKQRKIISRFSRCALRPTEINGWDYRAKSLYLANSLIGSARSLLNELTSEQRRDYSSLVQKLTARYGSENRAEVFRAQLKSRIKQKAETIPELAQAIKKLTRQAYPKADLDVIEALALDHFIDGLPEPEIRLRLREVGQNLCLKLRLLLCA